MESEVLFNNDYLFGNLILEAIPHPGGYLGYILRFFSIVCHYFSGITVFVIAIPLFYFFYSSRFGIKLAFAVISTGIVNGFFKFICSSPRPQGLSSQIQELSSIVKETSFGFPSGHSHISILVWGIIFTNFKNIYIRVIAIFFIIFTPFSRMYVGVHYPGDVLGGLIMGIVSYYSIEKFFKRYPSFPNVTEWRFPNKKVQSSILGMLAFTFLFLLLENNISITASKSSLSQVISSAGSLAGLWMGLTIWKLKYSKYDLEDLKIFKTLFLLVISILMLYIGLDRISEAFFKESMIFRYFRYALLNFVVIFIVPYLSLVATGEKEQY